MIAYKILGISGNSSEKLNCGNVVNMPYSTEAIKLSSGVIVEKFSLDLHVHTEADLTVHIEMRGQRSVGSISWVYKANPYNLLQISQRFQRLLNQ